MLEHIESRLTRSRRLSRFAIKLLTYTLEGNLLSAGIDEGCAFVAGKDPSRVRVVCR